MTVMGTNDIDEGIDGGDGGGGVVFAGVDRGSNGNYCCRSGSDEVILMVVVEVVVNFRGASSGDVRKKKWTTFKTRQTKFTIVVSFHLLLFGFSCIYS